MLLLLYNTDYFTVYTLYLFKLVAQYSVPKAVKVKLHSFFADISSYLEAGQKCILTYEEMRVIRHIYIFICRFLNVSYKPHRSCVLVKPVPTINLGSGDKSTHNMRN